jgi:hypothetical protein
MTTMLTTATALPLAWPGLFSMEAVKQATSGVPKSR